MPTLRELQHQFAAGIIAGDAAEAIHWIGDDAPGASARFAIYANHFRVTLIDALAATYPVVHQLVGDDFFGFAARRFVRRSPPTGPCLFGYGAGFADFLDALPEAASLLYLGDVARLEWAINAARHAPDLQGSELETIECDGHGSLNLHPSCGLVTSEFPVDRIWQAHQTPGLDVADVDLGAGSVRLLVYRDNDGVSWLSLPFTEAVFISSLLADRDLRAALAASQSEDCEFDATPLVAALIENDILTSLGRTLS